MRCVECEREECCNSYCCRRCGCCQMELKCCENDGDGCVKAIFWGLLALVTFGTALLIPLFLKEDNNSKDCVLVCKNCGYIQNAPF